MDGELVDLETLKETNKKLNRRLQELESKIIKNNLWGMGFKAGYEKGCVDGAKNAERKLAEYKHSTREELRKARNNN
jgi:hypothetical protein